MTVSTRSSSSTAIPIPSLLVHENELTASNGDSFSQPSCHVRLRDDIPAEAQLEISAAVDRASLEHPAPDSETIVVATYKKHKFSPVETSGNCDPESAKIKPTTRRRKRASENVAIGANASRPPKRPKRIQTSCNRNLPVNQLRTSRAEPVAMPSETTHCPVSNGCRGNRLPPRSIVTKSNRVTQEFRNGVTSVQVPGGHSESQTQGQPASPIAAEAPNISENTETPTTTTSSASPYNCTSQQTQAAQYSSQTPSHSREYGQPAVNFDCHTHVIQDQKIYTTYEKPAKLASNTTEANNARTQAYNKMTTKTVTITITTTIATTEIVRPGEPGYQEALERHRRQSRFNAEDKEQLRKDYERSKLWTTPGGARTMNGEKHWVLHTAAEAGRIPNDHVPVSTADVNAENEPIVKKEGEREVQVKIEVSEDATMDEVEELVKVKMEQFSED